MVLCLPKLLIDRKRKNMEKATSMLRRISFRNSIVLTLTPPEETAYNLRGGVRRLAASPFL